MYFWNINQLAIDIKENKLAPKDTMKYLLYAILISGTIDILGTGFIPDNLNLFTLIEIILFIIVNIIGIKICFNINANGDNKNFIERFICLNFPILIRLILYGIIVGLIYLIIICDDTNNNIIDSPLMNTIEIVVNTIFEIIYYKFLSFYLKKINH